MATYLFRFSYTPESWAALIDHPEDRREMLATRIFAFGGQLQGFWYSFGEHDGYALVELPDDVSAAAVTAAISATGSLRHLEAIVLMPGRGHGRGARPRAGVRLQGARHAAGQQLGVKLRRQCADAPCVAIVEIR